MKEIINNKKILILGISLIGIIIFGLLKFTNKEETIPEEIPNNISMLAEEVGPTTKTIFIDIKGDSRLVTQECI